MTKNHNDMAIEAEKSNDAQMSLTQKLWEKGYASFYATKDGTGGDRWPYIIALGQDEKWVFKVVIDYEISELNLVANSKKLEEVRKRIYNSPSSYSDGVDDDCGFVIYHIDSEEWLYAPYSTKTVSDRESLEKLGEVL